MEAQLYLERVKTLYRQGVLNDQFGSLERMQEQTWPSFVSGVFFDFFKDYKRLLSLLKKSLDEQNVDFKTVFTYVHQLKGGSASLGAQAVKKACDVFRYSCEQKDVEGCRKYLEAVRLECVQLETEMSFVFEMEEAILKAGGTVPVVD